METTDKTVISIQVTVKAPLQMVWYLWTTPESIVKWNNASEDWLTSTAQNDLRPGGKFNYRMEAKDGSFGFNFEGTYTKIKKGEFIKYTIADGRKVEVNFITLDDSTIIRENFEAENIHAPEMQRSGWQAILENFKRYTEWTIKR